MNDHDFGCVAWLVAPRSQLNHAEKRCYSSVASAVMTGFRGLKRVYILTYPFLSPTIPLLLSPSFSLFRSLTFSPLSRFLSRPLSLSLSLPLSRFVSFSWFSFLSPSPSPSTSSLPPPLLSFADTLRSRSSFSFSVAFPLSLHRKYQPFIDMFSVFISVLSVHWTCTF